MNHEVYREVWFESAYNRAYKLGYVLYRLVTPQDDDAGYILEDGETGGIDGIFTAAGVEEELDRIEDGDDEQAYTPAQV